VHSQPAVGAGLLFVVEEGAIVALHDSDGSIAWRIAFAETAAAPLVFDNGWLIAAADSGSVFAFRASDGGTVWRSDVGARANARPALAADRVYIPTTDRRIVALHVESGMPLWERRLGGLPNDVLALDDRLYVGSDDNYLYCIDAKDGLVAWRWQTGADVIGLPAADERLMYFVSLDNLLRALDKRSGNQRWKRPLPLRPTTGPVRARDALIVSGVAPMLRAYFARDGTPAGEVTTEGELAAPPYVFENPDAAAVIVVTRNLAKGAIVSALSLAAPPPPTPSGPAPSGPSAPVPLSPPPTGPTTAPSAPSPPRM
jgi:outer membrane protein assembly factor BamB